MRPSARWVHHGGEAERQKGSVPTGTGRGPAAQTRRHHHGHDPGSSFKAGTAVAAASALTSSIALADEAAAEEEPAEEPAAEDPAASGVQDGKYVTSALGHENYIYMETTFRGAIAKCRCLRNDETVGVGTYPCEQLPAKIQAQSVEVDALSGATLTSMAIKKAVRQAITDAGGDPTVDFCEPAPTVWTAPDSAEVDVAVIGAGTTGLICATR